MAQSTQAHVPWGPGRQITAATIQQLIRAINAQENRVALAKGEEKKYHRLALAKLQKEYKKISGVNHAR